MRKFLLAALLAALATPAIAQDQDDPWQPKAFVEIDNPAWSRTAVLYSAGGTLNRAILLAVRSAR